MVKGFVRVWRLEILISWKFWCCNVQEDWQSAGAKGLLHVYRALTLGSCFGCRAGLSSKSLSRDTPADSAC